MKKELIRKKVEEIMKEIEDYYKLSGTVDLQALALEKGVYIHNSKVPVKINALTIPLVTDDFVTIINSKLRGRRRIYVLAHELGHVLLGHYEKGLEASANLDDHKVLKQPLKNFERDADFFADELLKTGKKYISTH